MLLGERGILFETLETLCLNMVKHQLEFTYWASQGTKIFFVEHKAFFLVGENCGLDYGTETGYNKIAGTFKIERNAIWIIRKNDGK